MTETYYFNISSVDGKILTPRTGKPSLKVRTYGNISNRREIVFWFNRDDVANPDQLSNPGIRMSVTYLEEVAPNKFLLRDFDKREYNLELLYVE